MKCAGTPSAEFNFLLQLVGDAGLLNDLRNNVSHAAATTHMCTTPPGGYDVEDTFLTDQFTSVTAANCLQHPSAEFVSSTPALDVAAPAVAYTSVEHVLYTRVIPLVCLFGIVGNCLNLLALTSMIIAHRTPMDRMERSATVGLLALAVSDLFFCTVVMPLAFVEQVDGNSLPPDHITLGLVYQVYHGAVIGLCITLSTWLTVVMAVSRYLAICRPLHARSIIGMRFTVGTIVAAIVISVVLNAPRFLYDEIACVELPNSPTSPVVDDDDRDVGRRFYFPYPSYLRRQAWIDQAYHASYLVVGILIPLAVLAYCNFFLIRAIRRSLQLRRQFQQQAYDGGRLGYAGRAMSSRNFVSASSVTDAARTRQRQSLQPQQQQPHGRNHTKPPTVVIVVDEAQDGGEVVVEQSCRQRRQPSNPTNVITLTMTIIVIMNVVMVTPSEISNVFTEMINTYLHQNDAPSTSGAELTESDGQAAESQTAVSAQAYNIVIAVTNTLQTLNFACNFVLYCVVNVQFRRILRLLVTWIHVPTVNPPTVSCVCSSPASRGGGQRRPAAVRALRALRRTA